jgi:hypothetical protein
VATAAAVISAVLDSVQLNSWREDPRTASSTSGATAALESCDRRQPRYLRIRHHLRNQICPDRHSIEKVSTQPAPLMFAKHPQSRQVALREGRTVLRGAMLRQMTVSGWIGDDAGLSALVEQCMTKLH